MKKDIPKPEDPYLRELEEDLRYHFTQKKLIHNPDYTLRSSSAADDHMRTAAAVCADSKLSAGLYVQLVYDSLAGRQRFFSTSDLCSKATDRLIASHLRGEAEWKVEITNASIPYEDVWKQQLTYAKAYMKLGYTIDEVLQDPTLKFFAWFRILSTPEVNLETMQQYKSIAQKELNPRLRKFAAENGLDLSRLN